MALDIKENLELSDSDSVSIPLFPPFIKFAQLMPMDSINLRDNYCNFRLAGLEYLKKIEALTNVEIEHGSHRWDSLLSVTVNRPVFDRTLSKLHGMLRDNSDEAPRKPVKEAERPDFDPMKSKITYRDKECPIPPHSIEYYLCKLTFENFGKKIQETDITELSGKNDTPRSVYDAHNRLNKKVESKLGIVDLFGYAAAEVWIRSDLFM